ncbi:hypothetical protein J6590_095801 [Homalodisca vitripennis]|nr:hypothetical protein J6590_095801 [Homalodisca vitripennis]
MQGSFSSDILLFKPLAPTWKRAAVNTSSASHDIAELAMVKGLVRDRVWVVVGGA